MQPVCASLFLGFFFNLSPLWFPFLKRAKGTSFASWQSWASERAIAKPSMPNLDGWPVHLTNSNMVAVVVVLINPHLLLLRFPSPTSSSSSSTVSSSADWIKRRTGFELNWTTTIKTMVEAMKNFDFSSVAHSNILSSSSSFWSISQKWPLSYGKEKRYCPFSAP